jgi:hypothetical protein
MVFRILQKLRDNAALIIGGDRRVPPLAGRQAENALVHKRQLPGIEQPLEEIGRAEMDD